MLVNTPCTLIGSSVWLHARSHPVLAVVPAHTDQYNLCAYSGAPCCVFGCQSPFLSAEPQGLGTESCSLAIPEVQAKAIVKEKKY